MDKWYQYGDIRLSYSVEGEGDTIVLLHGWGCDRNIWMATRELLLAGHRVLCVDFAGFGSSDEPREVWGVEEYTRSLEALLDSEGVVRPTLVGHSFGGRVAIVYASRREVRSVVLTDAAGVKPRRKLSYYYRVYSFKLMKWLLPAMIGRQKAQMLLEQRRRKSGSADYNSASPMMRAILSRVVNEDLKHLMPKVTAPVLLFWGDRDTATPLSDAHIMADRMPHADLVVAYGAGHYAMLEQAELWQRSLQEFLTNVK